jgi:hypothetical protein
VDASRAAVARHGDDRAPLPAIAAAVWIAVGGLVLGSERTDAARLLGEVGPGVVLTGLLCTLISYHGRHHPGERRS